MTRIVRQRLVDTTVELLQTMVKKQVRTDKKLAHLGDFGGRQESIRLSQICRVA